MFMKAKEHSLRVDYFNNNQKKKKKKERTRTKWDKPCNVNIVTLSNKYNEPTTNKPNRHRLLQWLMLQHKNAHFIPLKFKMRYTYFCHIIIIIHFFFLLLVHVVQNLIHLTWNIADPMYNANGDDGGLLFRRKLLSITYPLWSNLLLLMSIQIYWICEWATSLMAAEAMALEAAAVEIAIDYRLIGPEISFCWSYHFQTFLYFAQRKKVDGIFCM